jgi:3-isopropylmalate dehydrogenase
MLRNKKKRVVAVHKSNVLRKGDGLFARICRGVSQHYPKISYTESYVDACAMNLIRIPDEFDVILTSNLYGDILSDEAAQVVGGLGLAPCANIGESFGLFEPVHGAAFDIAGKDLVNPSAMFLSIKMMLDWLGNKYGDEGACKTGRHLEASLMELLENNRKTKDLGGKLTTTEFTKLLSFSMY